MNTNTDNFLYKIGTIILLVAILFLSIIHIFQINYHFFSLPCLFYKITGLYCPGCGGTRSVHALMDGHLISSIKYNPIVLYGVFIYLWYMISNTIEYVSKHKIKIGMKYHDIYLWIGLAILILFCLIRNFILLVYGIDLTSF